MNVLNEINGVEIIDTVVTEITEVQNTGMGCAAILAGTIIIVGVVLYFISRCSWNPSVPQLLGILLFIIVGATGNVLLSTSFIMKEAVTGYDTTYVIRASDDVSLNEFCREYEIVEWTEDSITVRERTTDEPEQN